VAPGGSIRPTPDRVRETLFNWLAPRIAGMRCLDLFAGSGVLGLEAVSRGAAEAVFVERDPAAAHLLRAAIERLDCTVCRLVRGDARAYLAGEPTAFDLVFLDPPFGSGLLEASAARVVEGGWLADRGLLYLETAREAAWPTLPGLVPWREGAAGQVRYGLFAGARAD
jgi:16S rRNA (guanine966-N2)-methyltransferase